MSDQRRDFILFVEDIIKSIEKIEKWIENLDFIKFKTDEKTIDAIIRNFEVIGEAVRNIPIGIRKKYPNVEWKEAIGFRNILIHNYFGIDIESVWDTVNNDIPELKKHIIELYNNEKE